MSPSDLPKLWTTSLNISKFWFSKLFFSVENWFNLSKKKHSVKNFGLGDQLLLKVFLFWKKQFAIIDLQKPPTSNNIYSRQSEIHPESIPTAPCMQCRCVEVGCCSSAWQTCVLQVKMSAWSKFTQLWIISGIFFFSCVMFLFLFFSINRRPVVGWHSAPEVVCRYMSFATIELFSLQLWRLLPASHALCDKRNRL